MNLDELEKLADAATPGPWEKDFCPMEDAVYLMAQIGNGKVIAKGMSHTKDLDFIAAANPETILKLIAVARAASMPSITWSHWESPHLDNDEAYQLQLELAKLQAALKNLLGEPT